VMESLTSVVARRQAAGRLPRWSNWGATADDSSAPERLSMTGPARRGAGDCPHRSGAISDARVDPSRGHGVKEGREGGGEAGCEARRRKLAKKRTAMNQPKGGRQPRCGHYVRNLRCVGGSIRQKMRN
jgi:hypothetical protein